MRRSGCFGAPDRIRTGGRDHYREGPDCSPAVVIIRVMDPTERGVAVCGQREIRRQPEPLVPCGIPF